MKLKLAFSLLVFSSNMAVLGQRSTPAPIVIHCAKAIDVVAGAPLGQTTIVIEGEKIADFVAILGAIDIVLGETDR